MKRKKTKRLLAIILCVILFTTNIPLYAMASTTDNQMNQDTLTEGQMDKDTSTDSQTDKDTSTDGQTNQDTSTDGQMNQETSTDGQTEQDTSTDGQTNQDTSTDGQTNQDTSTDGQAGQDDSSEADDLAEEENGNLPVALNEENPVGAASAGSFVLAASTKEQNLIEPVRVYYETGDTIWTALSKSGYSFEKSGDFISKIQGVVGNYCIYCNDEGYDLNRSPEDITVVEFTEMTKFSKSRNALILRMVETQEMDQKIQDLVSYYYSCALREYRYVEEDRAATLLKNINDKIQSYEEFQEDDTYYTVTVNATQDGQPVTDLELEFEAASFSEYFTETGTSIELKPATYYYKIYRNGYNRVQNEITKKITLNQDTTLDVELPSGEWFGDVKLLSTREDADGHKIPFVCEQDTEHHIVKCYVDDRAGGKNGIFLYVEQGEDLPEGADLRYDYPNNTNANGNDASWNSEKNDYGTYVVQPGMQGYEYEVFARDPDKTTGYIKIQNYMIQVIRVPTADIVIKDGVGNSLIDGFDPAVTDNSVSTVEDSMTVKATPYGTEGYSVVIKNGDQVSEDGKITLSDGVNDVTVTVSHTNGQSRTYNFSVNKVKAVKTTIQAADDVSIEVHNFNDEAITPASDGTYLLVPGAAYTYVAEKEGKYFAKEKFSVADDGTGTAIVTAAEPEAQDALDSFVMYDASSTSKRVVYPSDKSFSTGEHSYLYTVSDANTSVYVQATPINGYSVKATWIQQSQDTAYQGGAAESTSIKSVDASGTATVLSRVLAQSGYGNTVTMVVYREENGVTYYQNYEMDIQRSLHLSSLETSTAMGALKLVDEDGKPLEFDRDVTDYQVVVVTGTDEIYVGAHFINEKNTSDCDGGYYALVNGEKYTDLSQITIPLDSEKEQETVKIEICHQSECNQPTTYQLTIKKREPVKVTFNVTPSNANIFVQNEVDKESIFQENGYYSLMPDIAYTYTVTMIGYKAKQVNGFTVSEDTTVTVVLEKAEENSDIDAGLSSEWPSFRDENNNAVLDEKTPIKAEDSVLYWANADAFDGYCGHPILVDGYLYTYDSKNLLKLDTVTGELVQRGGALVRSSSFSIQPPTYAEGMIFVGLSQGTIQAFNAKTMESLWVYQDPLGGQPNCQITYKDGYIYTGFWNSETAEANFVCISVTDEDPTKGDEKKVATWTHTKGGGYYWAGAYVDESGEFLLEGTDDGEGGYDTGHAHVLSMDPLSGKVLDDLELPHAGDIRSNITHDVEGENATGDYYFTSKGGYFYRVSVNSDGTFDKDSLKWIKLENGQDTSSHAMSTSTPTVYNGRAYVGVSGYSQFGQYTGHRIAVLNLESMTVAYYVPTQGYPQTSGILTRAYDEDGEGKVYVYFFDNYTPGKLRCISDKPGQTEMAEVTTEELYGNQFETGYVLFTPSGAQAEYALCNPIVDEYGTLYFRNDSNYMMALGSTITKLEVTQNPDKMEYQVDDIFDSSGMQVTATYSNGKTRDVTEYVTYSTEPLTKDDEDFAITFEHVMYQNKDGETGVDYTAPIAHLKLSIQAKEGSGVTLAGTVISWDSEKNLNVRLYDASVSDEDIRTDMYKLIPESARNEQAELGEVTANEDGKRYDQSYQFADVEAGEYKIAFYKTGKYVIKVVPVTVESENVTVDAQKLWLYGDVTYDGVVNFTDAMQIKRYAVKNNSVFSMGSDQDIADRLQAANVTVLMQKDQIINLTDAMQIQRYTVKNSSVFDSIP